MDVSHAKSDKRYDAIIEKPKETRGGADAVFVIDQCKSKTVTCGHATAKYRYHLGADGDANQRCFGKWDYIGVPQDKVAEEGCSAQDNQNTVTHNGF